MPKKDEEVMVRLDDGIPAKQGAWVNFTAGVRLKNLERRNQMVAEHGRGPFLIISVTDSVISLESPKTGKIFQVRSDELISARPEHEVVPESQAVCA
jgi:hypothetical protein